MDPAVVPDFLTVEEAARVLRIGRTTAYLQANQWLHTEGVGLPVMRVGGSLRVPRAQFEIHYGIRITAIPPPPRRRPKGAAGDTPGQDIPRPRRTSRRHKPPEEPQDGLPFAG